MAAQNHTPSTQRTEADTAAEDPDRDPLTMVSVGDSAGPDSTDLAATIERERLRARIRALERELVVSERHRQGLIDQYEQRLAAREEAASTDHAGTDDRSRLRRLLTPRR